MLPIVPSAQCAYDPCTSFGHSIGVVSMLGHLVHVPGADDRIADARVPGWMRRLWRSLFGRKS